MTIDELYAYIQAKSDQITFDENLAAIIDLHINGLESESLWRVSLAEGRAQLATPLKNSAADNSAAEGLEPDLTEASVSIRLSEETLLKLARQEIAPFKAFLLGRIKIKGDVGLLGQLKKLLPEA
ncbi:MAG: SCP2 sterol-binding domain-containing protein [Deltaproteobacteria bacterium]|jgi:putative sterol carrier protein|nr:SCP2 sterol-binding domain-containing protein [Deltaproteobacteria bacterium]